MVVKRFEYWTREGKVWTKWFPWKSDLRDKWQLNNRLKNEYKEVTEEEFKQLNQD